MKNDVPEETWGELGKYIWKEIKDMIWHIVHPPKRGDWNELSKEERLRAKAMMYGCAIHMPADENGNMVIEHRHFKDDLKPESTESQPEEVLNKRVPKSEL